MTHIFNVKDIYNYVIGFKNNDVLISFQGPYKIDFDDKVEYINDTLIIHRKRNFPLRFCELKPEAQNRLDKVFKEGKIFVNSTFDFGINNQFELKWI